MPRANVREQLIEAGLQTLHLHGFNGSGVQDITDAAGVPKGSFYNHFESKEALALQALERFWQNGAGRRALLSDTSVEPVERLRRYFRALDRVMRARGREGGSRSAALACGGGCDFPRERLGRRRAQVQG